ncbi:DUF6599 family protein [Parabacteroides sp. PF5-6]|uniref:DUF6599 family protein n=1 Tax=Parabacteroides sp. PF5-6 TaxID=1742403 RepID=UPI0024054369|nr:DUF6599 family protein [Parabacteroides sp. PF5-6]MDF9828895.1 hypothetical protein [Parabacteroides sp. PF5-6]
MKKLICILFLVLACAQLSIVNCQLSITRERVFTGAGLYGFMNGGADLYLEYEVYRLTNRDIEYKGEKYTVDIYELPTPEDAYGIYSMNVFRCERADTLDCIDCLSPYQLQAVDGNKFISVVFPSGSNAAKQLADEVLRQYQPMKGETKPAIPKALIDKPPYSAVVKYLRGPLSVSAASKSLSDLLQEIPYKGVWFKAEKGGDTYDAYILFAGTAEKDKLKEKIPAADMVNEGETFLYIRGTEKEEETPDYGPFGF